MRIGKRDVTPSEVRAFFVFNSNEIKRTIWSEFDYYIDSIKRSFITSLVENLTEENLIKLNAHAELGDFTSTLAWKNSSIVQCINTEAQKLKESFFIGKLMPKALQCFTLQELNKFKESGVETLFKKGTQLLNTIPKEELLNPVIKMYNRAALSRFDDLTVQNLSINPEEENSAKILRSINNNIPLIFDAALSQFMSSVHNTLATVPIINTNVADDDAIYKNGHEYLLCQLEKLSYELNLLKKIDDFSKIQLTNLIDQMKSIFNDVFLAIQPSIMAKFSSRSPETLLALLQTDAAARQMIQAQSRLAKQIPNSEEDIGSMLFKKLKSQLEELLANESIALTGERLDSVGLNLEAAFIARGSIGGVERSDSVWRTKGPYADEQSMNGFPAIHMNMKLAVDKFYLMQLRRLLHDVVCPIESRFELFVTPPIIPAVTHANIETQSDTFHDVGVQVDKRLNIKDISTDTTNIELMSATSIEELSIYHRFILLRASNVIAAFPLFFTCALFSLPFRVIDKEDFQRITKTRLPKGVGVAKFRDCTESREEYHLVAISSSHPAKRRRSTRFFSNPIASLDSISTLNPSINFSVATTEPLSLMVAQRIIVPRATLNSLDSSINVDALGERDRAIQTEKTIEVKRDMMTQTDLTQTEDCETQTEEDSWLKTHPF